MDANAKIDLLGAVKAIIHTLVTGSLLGFCFCWKSV
jgi:hypothetical protein